MDWKILLGLVVSYFLYLLIGAAVFQAIEHPPEEAQCQAVKDRVAEFKAIVNEVQPNITVQNISSLMKFVKNAAAYGVQVDENFNVTCTRNWDFQSAFFFSGTVVTTIGYGNIAPTTQLGRSICILYAIIGLPLFGLMFSGLGDVIAGAVTRIDNRIRGKAKRTWVGKSILVLIVLITFLTLCMLIPAAIFMAVEGWTYHDSFYYTFITLTTIGFGDFVVGTNPEINYIPIYRVLVYFWIIFGIAFMATLISLIGDFWKKTGQNARRKRIGTEEEDGADEGEEEEDGGIKKSEEGGMSGDKNGYEKTNVSKGEEMSSTESLEKRPFQTHYENVDNSEKTTEPHDDNEKPSDSQS